MPLRHAPAAPPTRTPCSTDPDRWFDETQAGHTRHQCLHHCPMLTACEALGPGQPGSIQAGKQWIKNPYGVLYAPRRQPLDAGCNIHPAETEPLCQHCGTNPIPEGRTNYCGDDCHHAAHLKARRPADRARAAHKRRQLKTQAVNA